MRHLPLTFRHGLGALTLGAIVAGLSIMSPSPDAEKVLNLTPTAARNSAAPTAAGSTTVQQMARATPRRSSGLLTLDWGDIDATPTAWKGNYLVLEPWEGHRIDRLKARNPHLTVLMYKNVAAVRKDAHETGVYSTGVSYREAAANNWLLTDRGGRVIEWSDWTSLYPVNIRDRDYQNQWADNVLGELRRYDWDGVMMDDTLTYLSHPTVGQRQPAQIDSDRAMYTATEAFLARVATRIKRAGHLAIPNVTVEWNNWRTVMEDWTRYVSGWENEYFVKWGLDRTGTRFVGADWEWKVKMAEWLAKRDVPLLAVTYSNRDDTSVQVYHRATWLLTWNGRTGSSVFVPAEPNVNHWTRRANVDIGTPTQTRHRVPGTGVWRRDYTEGTVLVNPTTTGHWVSVGDGYRTLNGKPVTRRFVPALSGAILRHR